MANQADGWWQAKRDPRAIIATTHPTSVRVDKHFILVTVAKDGPYMVSGAVSLATQTIVANAEGDSQNWREGKTIATPES